MHTAQLFTNGVEVPILAEGGAFHSPPLVIT